MKVLVTGASGFYGSHLVRAFLGRGHEVYAFHRETTSFWRLANEASRVHWFDLSRHSLAAPFEAAGHIEAVVHAAASYGRSGEPSSEIKRVNTLFPLQLLETAVALKCPKFINVDTYLHKERPGFNYYLTDDSITKRHPLTDYSITKKHFVDWGKYLSHASGIRFVNVKLEYFYGPADDPAKFTMAIAHACLHNTPEYRMTAGEQTRDFIYVDDAVSAMLLVLEHCSTSPGVELHELGTGVAITVREFAETVCREARSTTRLIFGVLPYREGEIMDSVADNASLLKLGWRSTVEWRQGVRLLLRHVIESAERAAPFPLSRSK